MTILRASVKMVRLTWQCDECHNGDMVAESGWSNAMGTHWLHKCTNCGNKLFAKHSYPYLDYEDIK